MLHQPTTHPLPRLMLTVGFCLTIAFVSQFDRNLAKVTATNLNKNGFEINGVALNGTSFNGTSFNGSGFGINGAYYPGFEITSPTQTTVVLKQKPVKTIRLEGGQLALKIKRAD